MLKLTKFLNGEALNEAIKRKHNELNFVSFSATFSVLPFTSKIWKKAV
jgi:hypothetical protein